MTAVVHDESGIAVSTRGSIREIAFNRPERMNSVRPDVLAANAMRLMPALIAAPSSVRRRGG